MSILILGLEGSGKTEIGHFLSKKHRLDFSQTNGSQTYRFHVQNTPVNLNEIGGSADIRALWVHYYREVHTKDLRTFFYRFYQLIYIL